MKTNEKIYLFIKDFINKNGFSPTVREIAKAVNLKSNSTVHAHLERLKDRNLITWNEYTPRTIRIVEGAKYYR